MVQLYDLFCDLGSIMKTKSVRSRPLYFQIVIPIDFRAGLIQHGNRAHSPDRFMIL